MNFEEQLNEIKNFKSLSDCARIFDFMLDYEHICLARRITTGYRHERITNFTDDEIIILAEALNKKTDELL